ncbi:hypothetical protein [Winogradskyella sp.]|uniref:hypothetical protein n=1 Tax=Winogradskyella sp. TaxID=1883156 RepID=UPI0026063390|nr:hypothetical protein [Winogradskyella sp.]
MDKKINSLTLNNIKIPGGPFPDMPWTTPLVTFQSSEVANGIKFTVNIMAQIPHGLGSQIKGPTLSKDPFDTGLGKGKMLHTITIEIPYRTHYEAPDLNYYTIEYVVKKSEITGDNGVFVNYMAVSEGQPGQPFPDPELERGTVTTTGVPDP